MITIPATTAEATNVVSPPTTVDSVAAVTTASLAAVKGAFCATSKTSTGVTASTTVVCVDTVLAAGSEVEPDELDELDEDLENENIQPANQRFHCDKPVIGKQHRSRKVQKKQLYKTNNIKNDI